MKKNYISPNTRIISLDAEESLMQVLNGSNDPGSAHAETGDDAEYSNYRRSTIWDNE